MEDIGNRTLCNSNKYALQSADNIIYFRHLLVSHLRNHLDNSDNILSAGATTSGITGVATVGRVGFILRVATFGGVFKWLQLMASTSFHHLVQVRHCKATTASVFVDDLNFLLMLTLLCMLHQSKLFQMSLLRSSTARSNWDSLATEYMNHQRDVFLSFVELCCISMSGGNGKLHANGTVMSHTSNNDRNRFSLYESSLESQQLSSSEAVSRRGMVRGSDPESVLAAIQCINFINPARDIVTTYPLVGAAGADFDTICDDRCAAAGSTTSMRCKPRALSNHAITLVPEGRCESTVQTSGSKERQRHVHFDTKVMAAPSVMGDQTVKAVAFVMSRSDEGGGGNRSDIEGKTTRSSSTVDSLRRNLSVRRSPEVTSNRIALSSLSTTTPPNSVLGPEQQQGVVHHNDGGGREHLPAFHMRDSAEVISEQAFASIAATNAELLRRHQNAVQERYRCLLEQMVLSQSSTKRTSSAAAAAGSSSTGAAPARESSSDNRRSAVRSNTTNSYSPQPFPTNSTSFAPQHRAVLSSNSFSSDDGNASVRTSKKGLRDVDSTSDDAYVPVAGSIGEKYDQQKGLIFRQHSRYPTNPSSGRRPLAPNAEDGNVAGSTDSTQQGPTHREMKSLPSMEEKRPSLLISSSPPRSFQLQQLREEYKQPFLNRAVHDSITDNGQSDISEHMRPTLTPAFSPLNDERRAVSETFLLDDDTSSSCSANLADKQLTVLNRVTLDAPQLVEFLDRVLRQDSATDFASHGSIPLFDSRLILPLQLPPPHDGSQYVRSEDDRSCTTQQRTSSSSSLAFHPVDENLHCVAVDTCDSLWRVVQERMHDRLSADDSVEQLKARRESAAAAVRSPKEFTRALAANAMPALKLQVTSLSSALVLVHRNIMTLWSDAVVLERLCDELRRIASSAVEEQIVGSLLVGKRLLLCGRNDVQFATELLNSEGFQAIEQLEVIHSVHSDVCSV